MARCSCPGCPAVATMTKNVPRTMPSGVTSMVDLPYCADHGGVDTVAIMLGQTSRTNADTGGQTPAPRSAMPEVVAGAVAACPHCGHDVAVALTTK